MRHGVRGMLAVAAAGIVVTGVPGVAQAATDTWVAQPVPMPSGAASAGMAAVSCPTVSDCEAVLAGDPSAPAAAQWNGTAWTDQPLAADGDNGVYPAAISCFSATDCVAAGSVSGHDYTAGYADEWDGTSWDSTPTLFGNGSALTGVSCPTATDCMAVGTVTTGGKSEPIAKRWNGSTWKSVSVPAPEGRHPASRVGGLNAVSCPSASSCFTVGYANAAGAYVPLRYEWNGTSWGELQQSPPPDLKDFVLTAVSCPSASNCFGVGDSADGGGNSLFAEHWAGTSGIGIGMPEHPGTTYSELSSLSCVSSRCTAVGRYTLASGTSVMGSRPLAEFFSGGMEWSLQQTAMPAAHRLFTSVSCLTARTCTAVGSTVMSNEPQYQPLAERETPPAT